MEASDGTSKAPLKAMTFEELFKSAWESEDMLDDAEEEEEAEEAEIAEAAAAAASGDAAAGVYTSERTAEAEEAEGGLGPEQRQAVDAEVEALLHGIASQVEWITHAREQLRERADQVDSHGRWKGPCLQTNTQCDPVVP